MIDIKVVNGRFVTCFPMPPERPEEPTWPQRVIATEGEKRFRHRFQGDRGSGSILDYIITKSDKG